ncbi:EamA family transporter [Sinomonas sp. ASV322]|uniref:DMT family transporter n=1 Tax=Sinomonas sp. ASV322 TaxID=3041920 RepID=UPI0027DBCF6A|nr:EamA family transporter [Sinomonas sp. ASV322]MDQ4501055.1 EamA family transporter [Sinomonas sp. ASV322]
MPPWFPETRSPRSGVAYVIAAAVLWGTTGTASALAPGVSPLAVGAASMGFGGLFLAVASARQISRNRALVAGSWPLVLIGGAALAVYALSFYTSMRLAGVAIGTAVSIGAAPVVSALIERIVDRRQLTQRWAAGALVGVAGTVLLCFARGGRAQGSDGEALAGVALGVVAAATYALYSWTSHRLMRLGVPSRASVGATFAVGAVGLLAVLAAVGRPFLDSWGNIAVGLYLAAVPMFVGHMMFGWGLSRVAASTATTASLAEPLVAAALAVAVVGERLPWFGWLGMALIVACLAVLTVPAGRPRFRPRRTRRIRGSR